MMKSVARLAALMAVLAQAVPPGALAGETFWVPYNGRLAAFSLDFETWETAMVSQGNGSSAIWVYAGATEPGTGVLWTSYYDHGALRETLGVWDTGASTPRAVATFSDQFLFDIEFSPTGVLYASGYDYNIGRYFVGTVSLTTGEVTQVVTFPADEYSRGLAFHPVDGKLYFSARNYGSSTALNYVDTLTLPGHQRTRVLDDSGEQSDIYAYEPFFDDAANLHLAAYNTNGGGYAYYRVTAQGLARLGTFPTYLNAFGPFTVNTLQFSPAGAALGCIPTSTRACLQGRRFQVEATYDATVFGGSAGTATPNVESDQSLKFSFFDPTNLELFLKVIDGCSYNGHYWVFVSGLTNAGVALQLTDKVTNAVYSYSNPAGQAFVPSLDIEAFACN